MSEHLVQHILARLAEVQVARERERNDAAFASSLKQLKAYQAARFERTYADLLHSSRYSAATRFFLRELYGPNDFSGRDLQFARVAPNVVRMFPKSVTHTVAALVDLHALSESLDQAMATAIGNQSLTAASYCRAWQLTARPSDRARQIALTAEIALALDQHTNNRLIKTSLRVMRGPAVAAGLADLQQFLETGFDAFAQMRGAQEFITLVKDREQALAAALFSANLTGAEENLTDQAWQPTGPLEQLPV